MSCHANFVKEKLFSIIQWMEDNKYQFLKNPNKDFTRTRKLSFSKLIELFLKFDGKSLNAEILENFNYNHEYVSVSAFVQQRNKINEKCFKYLFDKFIESFDFYKTYFGYRLYAVDGSDLLASHNPEDSDTYFSSLPGNRGYNMLHINALYDLINKVYVNVEVQPSKKQNERNALNNMIRTLSENDKSILLLDKGYESYGSIARLIEKNWNFLCKVKNSDSNGILHSLNLPIEGELDVKVKRILTRKNTKEIKARPDIYKYLPKNTPFEFLTEENPLYEVSFRVIRVYFENGTSHCFVTNLDKNEFPLEKISELYHLRWGIETSFRDLKHKIGLTHLHSKKSEHITQEIISKMIMFNFYSIITLNVAVTQKTRKYDYKINFSAAVSICKHFFKLKIHQELPDIEKLIQRNITPIRENRSNPRRIKQRTFVSFQYRVA